VWTDSGASCRFANSRTGSSSKFANGASSASGRLGGRAIAALEGGEHFSNAE
jgi:hypothetical protein